MVHTTITHIIKIIHILCIKSNKHEPKKYKINSINWKTKEEKLISLPQILMGASSSSKLGWLRKISLDIAQSCLISASVSCTCFVALPFFDSKSRLIISSTKFSSIPADWLQSEKPKTKNPRLKLIYFHKRYNNHKTSGEWNGGVLRRNTLSFLQMKRWVLVLLLGGHYFRKKDVQRRRY